MNYTKKKVKMLNKVYSKWINQKAKTKKCTSTQRCTNNGNKEIKSTMKTNKIAKNETQQHH